MLCVSCTQAGPLEDAPGDTDFLVCHWDCFFDIRCVDGVVIEQIPAPVPCASWTGMCPEIRHGRCTEGCTDRIPSDVWFPQEVDWRRWCRETEDRREGDPCTTNADCHPPQPIDRERHYLECDLTTEICRSIEPPVAPDRACEASFEGLSSPSIGYAYGVVADPSCESGWCRFGVRGEPAACVAHVCALECEDDWDCPPAYQCERRGDWTGRRVEEGAMGSVNVCVLSGEADVICR